MKKSNAGIPHTNSLNMEQRIKLSDWLRAERGIIPNHTVAELVEKAKAHLGRSCSAQQLRDIAKASGVNWNPKVERAVANPSRMTILERRVTALEAWCETIAAQLGVAKPELPSDEDLQE